MGEKAQSAELEGLIRQLTEKPARPLPDLTPQQIYDELAVFVIGQEKAKRKIALAAYNHIKKLKYNLAHPEQPLVKSNILLYGPTGCGKTHIARTLARILDLAIVIVDATDYTEAGYYGKDVETIIGELLLRTGSVEEAQKGVVFVDEIDKIAIRRGGLRTGAGNRDIGGEGVQQALLKLLEGRTVYAPLDVTQHWSRHDFVQVAVTNVLFICAGAFSDLARSRDRIVGGFSGASSTPGSTRGISAEELQKYGFMPEFIGRLPIRISMDALTDQEMLEVLTVPPDSILNEYRKLLELDDISLVIEEDAFQPIISHVQSKTMGARTLRTVMEEVLEETMFEAPNLRGTTVYLTRPVVARRLERIED